MRKIKKTGIGLLLALFLSVSISAQDAAAKAPIVSGLEGEVKNNLLRLTWLDSPMAQGSVYIYRSSLPLEERINNAAALGRPIEVPYGVQYYIDEIEEPGIYYYFAAASDGRGQRSMFLAPLANYITVTIGPTDWPGIRPEGAALPAQSAQGRANITVAADGNAVIVRFNNAAENVILYRSVKPIRMTADILDAVMVQPNASSPFLDYPVAGIPYYYAIINENDLIMGKARIVPGLNTTVEAIEILPSGDGFAPYLPARDIRNMPLPPLTLTTAGYGAFDERNNSGAPAALMADAAKALGAISNTRRKTPEKIKKEAQILSIDTKVSNEGERYILESITGRFISDKNWNVCRDELSLFLSQPRSETARAYARFYLGQCFYFLGMPRNAFFEFLTASQVLSDETAEWIQACISLIGKDSP